MEKNYKRHYQTPLDVCRYMRSMLPTGVETILEPTKGDGNIVSVLTDYEVTAPEDYFLLERSLWFDAVIMNAPFSSKSCVMDNAPARYPKGMKTGYQMLIDCMHKSDNIIALVPWFTISDSDVRLRFIKSYGLKSITLLPRKTFDYTHIQTCILQMKRGYSDATEFIVYDLVPKIQCEQSKKQSILEF